MPNERDVFLCHASEDKPNVLEPLVKALEAADISFWYDRAEIAWGASISQRVNEGLKISRFVIVVLSEASLKKNWPQRELNAALNMEASSGDIRVLPLIVGDSTAKKHILDTYPLIDDKLYLSWEGDAEEVVEALRAYIPAKGSHGKDTIPSKQQETPVVTLPGIRKQFTQRDKDVFLKEAFVKIRDYFRAGLAQAQKQEADVETDLTEIHNFRFGATIYVRGETASTCTIWLGGPISSDSIAFRYGISGESDNSCNDSLSVAVENGQLKLKSSIGSMISEQGVFSVEEAAKYYWQRFTDRM